MYLKGISSNSFLSYEVGAKFKEADSVDGWNIFISCYSCFLSLICITKLEAFFVSKAKTTKMNPSIIMASLSHFAACIRETFHACIDILINIRILQLAALGASHMIQYVLLAAMPWSYMCPVSFPRII